MTSRETRKARRQAERKAKKLEWKKNRLAGNQPAHSESQLPKIQPRWNPELEDEFPREVQIHNNAMLDRIALKAGLPIPPPGPVPRDPVEDLRQRWLARQAATEPAAEPIGFVSQTEPQRQSRAETNRANAQLSTGPRSAEGKLASSRNALKHGLAAGQVIIPGEDPIAFESLLNDLLGEHQPATSTEALLVKEMAQSHWLTQRAIRLQNECFTADGVNEKQLALFLRYQTTHQRAFYKSLSNLLTLRKARLKSDTGFVSQARTAPASPIGFVSQAAAGMHLQAGSELQTPPTEPPQTPSARPSPSHFDTL